MYSEGLMGLQEDAMRVAKIGLGIGLGIAGAKVLVDKVVPAYKFSEWINPVVLIGTGALVYGFGKDKSYSAWTSSFAAGWAAVGLGKLIGAALDAGGAVANPAGMAAKIKAYVPFAGVDTYDTGLLAGLGYGYDASVNRYMMAGSPTQVQQLMGAPLQVQQLAGLGSSVINGAPVAVAGSPMSATLM